jgi:hypothetical protein
MTDEKPIILHVELHDLLRADVGKLLRAGMPGHTVLSVENYIVASDLFDRCLGQGTVPLVVTEARPVEPGSANMPEHNNYGSAVDFINKALTAAATVIVFTNTGSNLPETVPGNLIVIEKPDHDKLLTEIRRQTSHAERTAKPVIVGTPTVLDT